MSCRNKNCRVDCVHCPWRQRRHQKLEGRAYIIWLEIHYLIACFVVISSIILGSVSLISDFVILLLLKHNVYWLIENLTK
uniref:Uncharacterized protein n=1 Tax=Kalanchoe fedtschenkoi TaxID=63787 RepID=A0A7N0U1L0_KALFE